MQTTTCTKAFLFLIIGIGLFLPTLTPEQSLASGCTSASFYNMETLKHETNARYCWPESLEKISTPISMADRQYNYFVDKMNEYLRVLGPGAIDGAQFEFIFYAEVRKNLLTAEDARKIDFVYTQSFACYRTDGTDIKVTAQIYAYGVTGLTGVCLYKDKQNWL